MEPQHHLAPGAIVMAAGAGQRIGNRPKSLLLHNGQALLLHQIGLLAQVGAHPIVVVLGHHAQRIIPVLEEACNTPALAGGRLRWTINPAPDNGPGSSLRCALAMLPAGLPCVLVTLGDQPLLQAADVQAMLHAWHAREPDIDLVVPHHGGQPGHPIALGPAVRQAVMQAPGHQGVREWRHAHPTRVQFIPFSHTRYTTDIDTSADLQRLHDEHGVQLHWPPDLQPPTNTPEPANP